MSDEYMMRWMTVALRSPMGNSGFLPCGLHLPNCLELLITPFSLVPELVNGSYRN